MIVLILSGSIQYDHNSVILKISITNFSQNKQAKLSVVAHICNISMRAGGSQHGLQSEFKAIWGIYSKTLFQFKKKKKATHNSINHRIIQNKNQALSYPEETEIL